MAIDLNDIGNSLRFDGHSHERRIMEALGAITTAKRLGGEILYLTPSEHRYLCELGDVLFLLREFVQYGDKELPASSVMVAAAKALLAKIEGPPRLGLTYEHTFTVKIQSKKPRKAVESRLFALLDSEFVNYWIGHEVEPVASSQPAPAASSPPPAPAPPPPPSPLDFVLHQFRDLSQAMLGMCDCDKPDEKALGDALREWICMRDQLDIYLLPNKTPIPLAGRDLDSSCGD